MQAYEEKHVAVDKSERNLHNQRHDWNASLTVARKAAAFYLRVPSARRLERRLDCRTRELAIGLFGLGCGVGIGVGVLVGRPHGGHCNRELASEVQLFACVCFGCVW